MPNWAYNELIFKSKEDFDNVVKKIHKRRGVRF